MTRKLTTKWMALVFSEHVQKTKISKITGRKIRTKPVPPWLLNRDDGGGIMLFDSKQDVVDYVISSDDRYDKSKFKSRIGFVSVDVTEFDF